MAYTGKKPTDFVDVTQTKDFTVTEDLTVDTNTLVVDSTNNRVGIGTSSPAESIHTTGNIRFGDTAPAELYTNSPELRLGVDRNNDNGITNITFYVDNSERMRIDSNGNVSIGTTSTSSVLEVAKDADPSIRLNDIGNWAVDLHNYGSVGAFAIDNGGTERLRIDSSGNVLVGTTTSI